MICVVSYLPPHQQPDLEKNLSGEPEGGIVKAEIIASGTELLLGEITDTNTPFIASQLASLGIDLYYVSIVGDNYERFLGVLKQAFQRSDIVIITGGLGPTKGDITREVIAGLVGEKMEVDPALREHISRYFARLGLEMPENNLKQATLIPSARAIPNPLGTAPGWWVEKNGKIVISLPGPPGEMQPMWQKEIHPRLERMGEAVIISRTLKTWGLSEARIDQMVGQYMSLSNPTLALYAKPDGIHLRITAKSSTREEALKLIQIRENEIRQILGTHIWGVDAETLEEIISHLLIYKGFTVGIAETFTGGMLSQAFCMAPDYEKFFKGGIVINRFYPLNSSPEQVASSASPETALRLAEMAGKQFDADIGIGIDGVTSSAEKDQFARAFIAIHQGNSGKVIQQTYQWRPEMLARRTVTSSLLLLRKSLID